MSKAAGNKKDDVSKDLMANASAVRVEAIISVDERGQMVLPKDVRKRAGIMPGDKLAVTSWQRDGKVCCLTLSKVEDMSEVVKSVLGPVLKEIV